MPNFIHADIFFFITSIAIILVTAGVIVALVYLIRVLRDAQKVTRKVRQETELIAEDIDTLRKSTREQGQKFKNFLSFFAGSRPKPKKRPNRAH